MMVLGCTGGIGSGKSYVSRIFEAKGIPVYNSDDRCKALYDSDIELLNGLARILGEDVVCGGKLDKTRMAQKIFSDKGLMARVRAFVYPFVMRDFCKWRDSRKARFVLLESAVLLEDSYVRRFADKVLVVTAPLQVRIARVMERDGATREEALARINSQWSDEKRLASADYVIESVTGADLESKVARIINDQATSPTDV